MSSMDAPIRAFEPRGNPLWPPFGSAGSAAEVPLADARTNLRASFPMSLIKATEFAAADQADGTGRRAVGRTERPVSRAPSRFGALRQCGTVAPLRHYALQCSRTVALVPLRMKVLSRRCARCASVNYGFVVLSSQSTIAHYDSVVSSRQCAIAHYGTTIAVAPLPDRAVT